MDKRRTIFTPQRYIPLREADKSWMSYLMEAKDPPGLIVQKIDDTIGKGVFTKNKIPAGSFIVEYSGELIDSETAKRREREYPKEYGSFLLFFRHRRKLWCIDATFSKAYGRFVNDGTGEAKNAELKVVVVKNNPHVVLFADRNIKPNEEIRFNYGVQHLPWRLKTETRYSRRFKDVNLETKVLHKYVLKNCNVLVKTCDKALASGKMLLQKEDGTFTEVLCNERKNDTESIMSLTDKLGAICTIGNVHIDGLVKHISYGHGYQSNDSSRTFFDISKNKSPEIQNENCEIVNEFGNSEESIAEDAANELNDTSRNKSTGIPSQNCEVVNEFGNSEESAVQKTENSKFVERDTYYKLDGDNLVLTNDQGIDFDETTYIGSNKSLEIQNKNCDIVNEFGISTDSSVQKTKESIFVEEDADNGPIGENSVLTNDQGNEYHQTTCTTTKGVSEITVIIEDQNDSHENCTAVMQSRLFDGHIIEDTTRSREENALNRDLRELSLLVTKTGNLITLSQNDETSTEDPENNETSTKAPASIFGKSSNKSFDESPLIARKLSEEDESASLLRIEDPAPDERNETCAVNKDCSDQVEISKMKCPPKPHRPCPYCMCSKSALTKHLKAKHSDEAEVKKAMSLPKKKQNRAFLLLKRKGIMVKNMEMLRDSSNKHRELLVERKFRKANNANSKDVIYCSKCFGFFRKEYFHRHRRTCHLKEEDSIYVPFAISPQNKTIQGNSKDDFDAEVLSSLHNDDIGKTCKNDSIIQDYGRKKFRKLQKRKQITNYEDRKIAIRTEMRRLGHLFNEFSDVCHMNKIPCDSSVDMLKRDNFNYLQTAIENMTIDDDGEIKPGLRKEVGYLLKRFAKYLHGFYTVEKKDDTVSELNKFLDVLNHFWQDVFGEAEYALSYKRQTKLRKPQNLPKEKDIKKLRDVMLSNLTELTESEFSFITSNEYRLLRDIVVSRLTLFNARRGGEPSRLTIHQWEEADQDNWIGEKSHNQDPIEKALLGKFKITYQAGKGGRLVPLLILNDCWKALAKLCDNEIRKQAGIHPDNTYVFPLTQYSKKHVSGWKSVRECCSMANLETIITATSMRHYMATVYAGLEMPESERETFYAHMGHSASINKNVYQSPLARQAITKIGKFLEGVDTGIHGIAKSSKAATCPNIEKEQSVNNEESRPDTIQKEGGFTQTTDASDSLKSKEDDSDYHPSTEDSAESSDQNTEEPNSPKKKRTYITWEKEDTRLVQKYFRKYIFSSDVVTGNCGPLPNVKELKSFLVTHPNILKEYQVKDQIVRLRTKIFNERKLSREKLSKSTGKEKRSTDI